jgi:hypothetical protein
MVSWRHKFVRGGRLESDAFLCKPIRFLRQFLVLHVRQFANSQTDQGGLSCCHQTRRSWLLDDLLTFAPCLGPEAVLVYF